MLREIGNHGALCARDEPQLTTAHYVRTMCERSATAGNGALCAIYGNS